MEQLTNQPAASSATLQRLYAPVAEGLSRVGHLIDEETASGDDFVDRLVRHGFRLGGKRLRPALVLLSGAAVDQFTEEHVRLAAAVELIHVATLIHDDVLDEAALRRHLATVNARWDNEASVLLGDYLFTRAMCLAASVEGADGCRIIGEASRVTCEGELRQMNSRGNFALEEDEYIEIVTGKTAALIACCCRLGAHYAGADKRTCDLLGRYGEALGIAFQIADDLLDLTGEESTTGKSLGSDLAKQKPTLPLIHVLQQADAAEKARITEILQGEGNHHAEALRPYIERYDAVGYARHRAEQFTESARRELLDVEDSPARQALLDLTRFVVERRA